MTDKEKELEELVKKQSQMIQALWQENGDLKKEAKKLKNIVADLEAEKIITRRRAAGQ